MAQRAQLNSYTSYQERSSVLNQRSSNTSIVGFATTADDRNFIKSVQVIYYSKNATFCSNLAKSYNSNGVKYIYPETYTGTNWLIRFIVEGKIDYLTGAIVGVVVVIVVVIILVGLFLACRAISNRPRKFAESEERY